MIRLNMDEAKTHMSRYLAKLKPGDIIVLCRRNRPVAELRALPAARRKPRPLGLAKGFEVPATFLEPLPKDSLGAFEAPR